MKILLLIPLAYAKWSEWESEKFCGYSLTMVAEDISDDYTQEKCLKFCKDMDDIFGPLYLDDPNFCCDYE